MKKWFNTNYHYIVPEAEDSTQIRLTGNKLWAEYAEAKELGIETKPVITGVYTLFKLCRFTGKKRADDFINAFIEAYKDVYSKCEAVGIQWLQFDEPALVQDMTEEDRELFVKMYSDILGKKKSCKVLLQTYFGDVRDVYEDIVKLSFDGIGLDFIEGKKTAELIEKYGFPKDTVLFAGLVNGKNIWKNHYEKTLNVLKKLEDKGIQTVLSTSCSLQHVPYTLKHENKLSDEYLNYFAFAEEKLVELKEFRRKNLHYRSCLQLQSVHFHRQKMLRPTVQHSVRVKSAKNSMLNLIRRKLKNVSDGRKKSDLMYLFMENTKEMTWLNILVKRWEVFCSQRKHGFSHMEQDVLNHLLYGEMFTARSR